METFRDGPQVVLDGHNLSRTQALEACKLWLMEKGNDEFEVEEALVDRPNRVARVWWDEQVGICNSPNEDNLAEGHKPQPVTVINTSMPD